MKSLKPAIIFYSIMCGLFLIGESVLYALNKFVQSLSPGAEMVFGLLVPFILFIFFCVGVSSLAVGYFLIDKYIYKAFIPFLIVAGTVLLYIIIPETDYSIWYRVIKFYF